MKEPMEYILDFQLTPERTPKAVVFEITKRCNLVCTHCYNAGDNQTELKTEAIYTILKKIPAPAETLLGFTGGEVLLREDFFDIVRYAVSLGFKKPNIDTNGVLLEREMAEQVYECGIRYAQVSIDGTEAEHDWVRGKGAFRKLIANITNIRNAQIETMANMTVHKKNMNQILPVWELLHSLGITSLKVEPLIAKGRGEKLRELLLEPDDVRRIGEILQKIAERRENPQLILDNLFKTYIFNKPSLGCPSARTFCIITHQGKMVHCPVFTDIARPEDDLLQRDFQDIWEKSQLLTDIRNLEKFRDCQNCQYLPICAGGCHARAYAAYGSLFKKDPMCPF